jgi:hypothetical protein
MKGNFTNDGALDRRICHGRDAGSGIAGGIVTQVLWLEKNQSAESRTHARMRENKSMTERGLSPLYRRRRRPHCRGRRNNGNAANRNHTTHQHVLVVGDGEGSPSVKGIEERINVRDVPVR